MGATASRDIRDFFTRSTRSSSPAPDPNLRLSATPTCGPFPNLNPTTDPNPTLILDPPSSPGPSPGPARHPSPDLGIDPVHDPNPTSGAERSTRSSGAHTRPFPLNLSLASTPTLSQTLAVLLWPALALTRNTTRGPTLGPNGPGRPRLASQPDPPPHSPQYNMRALPSQSRWQPLGV